MLFLNIIKTNDTSIFINNLIFCNYLNIFTLPKHENLRKKVQSNCYNYKNQYIVVIRRRFSRPATNGRLKQV